MNGSDADLTDMPIDERPLVIGDLSTVPVGTSQCDPSVVDDPGVEAFACGYEDATVCTGSDWRAVRVMCVQRTEELSRIFEDGPVDEIEVTWWLESELHGQRWRALNCTVTTTDVFGDPARFTVVIGLLPILVEAFASVPVFGLSLVDDDGESNEGSLGWFLENNLDVWAYVRRCLDDESDGDG